MPVKAVLFSALRTSMALVEKIRNLLVNRFLPTTVFTLRWSQLVTILGEHQKGQQGTPKVGFLRRAPSNVGFLLWKGCLYTFTCSVSARAALVSYLQFTQQPIQPYSHLLGPLFVVVVEYFRVFNVPHTMAAASIMALDALYVDYATFFKLDTEFLDITADVTVKNRRHFKEPYGGLTLWEKTRLFVEMRKAPNGKVFAKNQKKIHLRNFPEISENILANAYLLGDIVEAVFACLLITGLCIGLGACSVFLIVVYPSVPMLTFLFIAIEMFAIVTFLNWSTTRLCAFAVLFTGLLASIWRQHLQVLEGQISAKLTRLCSFKRGLSTAKFLQLASLMAQYREGHCRANQMALAINEKAASEFTAVNFVTNILANAIMMRALLYDRQMPLSVSLVFITALVVVMCMAMMACLDFIYFADGLHSHGAIEVHYKAQTLLQGTPEKAADTSQMISPKWKLLQYTEVLNSSSPFAFTLGPFGSITKFSFGKSILTYTAFLFYIFKLLRKY